MTEARTMVAAPLLRRVGAAAIDWLVYAFALGVLLTLRPLVEDLRLPGLGPFSAPAVGAMVLASVVVYQLILVAKTGQSLGKRWLRIEIVRTDGRRPGIFSAVLLRSGVPALVPIVASLAFSDATAEVFIGFPEPLSGQLFITSLVGLLDVLLLFSPNRRCLHDYVAGTMVVTGYSVPARVRHAPLVALAALIAPVAVFSSVAISFTLLYVKSCTGRHKDCDGRLVTLCEADLDSNKHCGACGNECSEAHASASCATARCVLTCDQGFADCDGNAGNGCEAELSTNGAHCGGCAVDCQGASCTGEICGPRRLGRGAVIAVDDGAVYMEAGDLMKIPLDGSPPVRLASHVGQHAWSSIARFGITVDKSHVYWAPRDHPHILAVPIGGGPVVVAATTAVPVPVMAVTGDSVVWVDGVSEDVLMAMATSGGKPVVAVSRRYPGTATRMFGAHATGLAWANDQGLWFLASHSSLPPKKLVDHGIPWSTIAVDSTRVYWAEWNALMVTRHEGGSPKTLASIHTATPLLLDEEFVYWADSVEVEHRNTTFVMKVSKNGGQPIQLTSHPSFFNGFALNSTHLFWTDERGDIFMFPKKPR